jgi:hypothetical protein
MQLRKAVLFGLAAAFAIFLFSPFIVEAATGAANQFLLSIAAGLVIGAIAFILAKARSDKGGPA